MATLTFTTVADTPKTLPVGLNTVYGRRLVTATAGSVLLFCKIPNKATIVGGYVVCPSDSYDIIVGDDEVSNRYLAVAQISSAVTKLDFSAVAGVLYKVDLSDAAVPQYTHLKATVTSASITGTVMFMVQYLMGQE